MRFQRFVLRFKILEKDLDSEENGNRHQRGNGEEISFL